MAGGAPTMAPLAAPASPVASAPAWVRWPAVGLALMGGVLLLVATFITVFSVAGRALVPLGLGPVPGDVELVEMSVGVAIFAFLPYCQLARGHVTVDILVGALGASAVRTTTCVGDLLLAGVTLLLAWRLWAGLEDRLAYGDTTFILRLPVWLFYAPALVCLCVAALVTLYTLARSAAELRGGRA